MPISEQVIGIRGWKGVHLHDVCTSTRFSPLPLVARFPIPLFEVSPAFSTSIRPDGEPIINDKNRGSEIEIKKERPDGSGNESSQMIGRGKYRG